MAKHTDETPGFARWLLVMWCVIGWVIVIPLWIYHGMPIPAWIPLP